VAAVFPVHPPRAVLRAHGLLPVEVWGPPGAGTASADSWLQVYTCSIVRCGLSFVRDGGLEVADVLVLPHACDSLQGLASVLLDQAGPGQPVVPIYLPRGEGRAALDFLAEELAALSARLGEITGRRPTSEELAASVAAEERADGLLAELHHRRLAVAGSARDFYRLVRSREYLPAELFAEIAGEALSTAAEGSVPGIPVVLSGILPEPWTVLDAIEEAGGTVVADDLAACGRRLYPPGRSTDPIRRVAEGLIAGPPDSTRGSSVAARARHLRGLVEGSGARAVVFLGIKFCEPELFYLPLLRRELEEAGVRSLTLEVDIADRLPAQTVTRIQALLETLP
jgi:benzoyl-CoA reductase/2-hydroxyglutaryl-CoA dehydratase subunit BcrC/BadD/HgdB